VLFIASSGAAVFGTVQLILTVMAQAVHVTVRPDDNVTSPSTVASIRPAERNILLPSEPYGAGATVPTLYPYIGSIKHMFYISTKLYNNRFLFVFQQYY
jgi:hypothetical protein